MSSLLNTIVLVAKRSIYFALLILILQCSGYPSFAGTITLTPTDDSYVQSGNPSTNYGTSNQLIVKGGTGGTIRYVYLKFDLSSIPGTVTGATLRLYGSSRNSTADTIVAYSVGDTSWTESGITWSNMPVVGSTLSTTSVSTSTSQYYSWDVTSSAQNKGTISLAVKMTNTPSSDQGDSFNAKEASSNLPQLVVTYTSSLNAPTGLTAIPGSGHVNLHWNSVTDATGYNIKRSTASGGPYTILSGSPVAATSFSDTSVTNGTTYYYVVSSVNSPDESANSNEASATPNTSLSAPTGLFANGTTGSVTLTWNAVSGASSYNVYRSNASGGEGISPYATGATALTYADSSVTNGVKYYYTVTAVNNNGVESAQSTEVSAVPLSIPSGLTATPGNAAVTLNWTDVSYALGYKIYRSTTPGGEGSASIATVINSRSYVDSGLTNGTTYYYKITAYRGSVDAGSTSYSESSKSSEVSATPLGTLPATPLNGIAVPGTANVYLSWGSVDGAASYNVKRSDISGGPYTTVASPTVTNCTDTPPVINKTYYYVVSAVNAAGEGAYSNEVAVQVPSSQNMSLLADSYVRQESPDTNYGTIVNAYAASSSSTQRNAYFRFGLSGIGGAITQAKLAVYGYGTTTATLNVASVADLSWSESGITWNNAPSCGATIGSASVGTTSQYYYFDITSYVQAQQLAGANAISLALLHPSVTDTFTINTKESANNPPMLLLTIGAPLNSPNLSATGGIHQVNLSWTSVAGASSYNLYRSISSGGEGAAPYATGISANVYTDNNVSDGVTYYYRVSAVNINGEGALSNEASATTQSFNLSANPTSVSVDRLSSSTSAIVINPIGGFTGSVTLSASNLPTGVTASFGTNPATGSSIVTFSAASGTQLGTQNVTITGTSGVLSSSVTIPLTINNVAPTIATHAVANPNPVTGTTTSLSVLGADDGGEANLSYTWSVSGTPPSSVTFTANGTNAAKSTTATFTASGAYTFVVTVTDQQGLSITDTVNVTVNSTPSAITVSPASVILNTGGTQQFTASASDQFGVSIATQPSFTWSVDSGVGSINTNGLYTAGYTAGSTVVRAACGAVSGTANVTVTNAAPTIATHAVANPNPVTGTTTDLSVLGADDGGEPNLTYTWSLSGTPPASVTFSANGTNAAKNTTATFTASGTYAFVVTVTDQQGLSVTDTVNVTVVTIQPPVLSAVGLPLSVNLSWQPVSGANTYNVYRSTSSGGEGNVPIAAGLSSLSYSDTNVTPDTLYYYQVTAVASNVESGKSNEVNAASLSQMPNAPLSPSAQGATSKVTLIWDPVPGASSYRIYRSTMPGGEWFIPYVTNVPSASFIDLSVSNGITYYYQISAVNSGGEGYLSYEVYATPLSAPVPSIKIGNTSQILSWSQVSGATSYNIYRSTDSNQEGTTPYQTGITNLCFMDTNLTNSTTYYYQVTAAAPNSESDKSNEVSGSPTSNKPMAPTGLSAAGTTYQVTLTWTAVSGATSYNLYRATTSGNEGTTAYKTGLTALTYADTSVSNGITYYYYATAVNANGESSVSNEVASVPLYAPYITAHPSDSQIILTWSTMTGASSYNIYRSLVKSGEGSTPYRTGVANLTFTDTGLANGQQYYYQVTSAGINSESSKSNEISATPNIVLPAPANLAATGATSQVNLSWGNVPGASSYTIYRGTSSNGEGTSSYKSGVTTNSYNDSATNGYTYYYKVTAVLTGVESAYSNEASATALAAPAPIAKAGDSQITLSWPSVSGATAYNVYRSTTSGAEGTTPYQSAVPSTSFIDTGLTNGVKYYYKVSAIAPNSASDQSSEVSATPNIIPSIPSNLTATASGTQISLSWNSVAGAISYNIYRSTSSNGEGSTPYKTGVTSPNYTDSGSTGYTYYYKVTAVGAGTESSFSNEALVPVLYSCTSLTAKSGNGQIVLNWSSYYGNLSYNIYRSTTSGGEGSVPYQAGVKSTTYADTNVVAGTKYYYQVTVADTNSESAKSGEASATAYSIGAPANLTAYGTTTKVSLTWDSVPNASSYTIYRNGSSYKTGITTNSYDDTSVSTSYGYDYYYYITAIISGVESYQSNTALARVLAVPAINTIKSGDGYVALSWSSVYGATGYNIYRSTTSGAEGTAPYITVGTSTTYNDTGVSNGTTYYYQVTATYTNSESDRSVEKNAIPNIPLSSPANLTAKGSTGKVTLTWDSVAGSTGYNIYRRTSSVYDGTAVFSTGATVNTYTDSSVSNATFYFYKVTAVQSSTESASSNETYAESLTAPTNLVAYAGDSQIKLSWTAVTGAVSYNVYRSTSHNGEGSTPYLTGILATTITDSGLADGTTYYYQVTAAAHNSESNKSSEVNATPNLQLPAPANLIAKGTTGQIVLTWSSVAGATTYNLYRGVSSGNEGLIPYKTGITTSSYTDTSFISGANTYYYIVVAVLSGVEGAFSNEVYATNISSPSLTATAGDSKVTLTWTATGYSYNIYRSLTSGGEGTTPYVSGITNLSYVDTGVTNDTTYYYQVTAAAPNSESTKSTEKSAKPSASLPSSANLTAKATGGNILLSWTSVPGATSYKLYRGTVSGGESVTALQAGLTATTYTDGSINYGYTYYYKVTAVQSGIEGSSSNETFATTLIAPSSVVAKGGDSLITLNWASVTGAAGYNIYRSLSLNGEGAVPYQMGVASTQFIDYNLNNGTTYYYQVTASAPNSESNKSSEVFAIPNAQPATPNNLIAQASSSTQISLNWDAVSGADSYNIYRSTIAGNEGYIAYKTGISSASYADSVSTGATYYYKVTAVHSNIEGFPSVEASATALYSPRLVAKPGVGAVLLSWSSIAGAASYNIYRSTTSNGEGVAPYQIGVTSPSYTDSGLANGTTYYYQVTAVAPNSESNKSTEAYATPQDISSSPTNLVAIGTPDGISLTWTGVPGADSYNIYYGFSSGNETYRVNVTATNYTHSGINGTFYYIVTAVKSGVESPKSNEASATAIRIPSITSITPGNAQVTLIWSSVNTATSYNIYRSTTQGGEGSTPYQAGITSLAFTDTGLTNGTKYYYQVTAAAPNSESSKSSEASTIPNILPLAPTNLVAASSDSKISLSWSAVTGASTYNVYRSTTAGGEGNTPYISGLSGTSLDDTSVTNGTTYYYKVTAATPSFESAASYEAHAMPLASTFNLIASGLGTYVTLVWTSVPGATSYNIYFANTSGGESSSPSQTGVTLPFRSIYVSPGYTYYYRVTAVMQGMEYCSSNEASVTTFAAPASLSATAGNASVSLKWNAVSGANAYNLYRSKTPGGEGSTPYITGITNNAYTDNSVDNNTRYYYQVTATSSNYESGVSNEANTLLSTPPSAPQGLTIKATTKKVALTWNAVSNSVTYNVYRGTAAGAESSTPIATGISTPSYLDNSVSDGAAYYYYVTAVNGSESSPSVEVSATPLDAPAITALHGSYKVVLSWNSVNGAAYYNIYRSTIPGGKSTTPIKTGVSGTSFSDDGLTNSIIYYYQVTAVAQNSVSSRSNEASAMPQAPPPAPANLNVVSGNSVLNLTWDRSSGALTYNIYRSTTRVIDMSNPYQTGITASSYSDTNVSNGTTYYYQVAAVNEADISDLSNEANGTPQAPPDTPGTLVAVSGTSQISLSWTSSARASTYNIYRSNTAAGEGIVPYKTLIGGTSYIDQNVSPNLTYYYQVTAVNCGGESDKSNEASAIPLNGPPTIQQIASANPNPVTNKVTNLAVLGADDGGENNLIYSWSASGPAEVSYLFANGTNSAKNNVATFSKAGNYHFTVTITDSNGSGLSASSSVDVVVSQTATAISIVPATLNLHVFDKYTLIANVSDQFGNLINNPSVVWSVTGGIGSIDSSGNFDAGAVVGTSYVKAICGNITGNATIYISHAPPSVVNPATANPNPVVTVANTNPVTMNTQLSVLGYYDGGESNLTYTWSATGPAAVTFSSNGTNAAKNATATFTKAGSYTITATITAPGYLSTTSVVTVVVNQILTSIKVNPPSYILNINGSTILSATAFDQFGNSLASQPQFTWSVDAGGLGSVDQNGHYSAPSTITYDTVRASYNGVSGTSAISVINVSIIANPAVVTRFTTNLSLTGLINPQNYSYTWSGAAVFSDNYSSTAYNTVATFSSSGIEPINVTIKDQYGSSTIVYTSINVNPTLSSITINPSSVCLNKNQTQSFTFNAYDQFGSVYSTGNTAVWSIDAGGVGTIDQTGLYAAPSTMGEAIVRLTIGSMSQTAYVKVQDDGPSVTIQATANPNPVTGNSTQLSVEGTDSYGLTYLWVASDPSVVFFDNNTATAKNTTASFNSSGWYAVTVYIIDELGLSTTSTVWVEVDQTASAINITPVNPNIGLNSTLSFSASEVDQFGLSMASQPSSFNWSIDNGGVGSIDQSGNYASGNTPGTAIVRAIDNTLSGTSNVTVQNLSGPSVVNAASADPNPVTGTTTSLTVLGDDPAGESNLIYTWSSSDPTVTFSDNGTNSAKNTTATFVETGSVTFTVLITDALNLSVTSSVSVTVNQTQTSMSINPDNSVIRVNGNMQYTAYVLDQFGLLLTNQPTPTWTVDQGIGTINQSGYYTAPASVGTATIKAAVSDTLFANATVNIVSSTQPVIITQATANPATVTGTTTDLSVVADDGSGNGGANLIYTWSCSDPSVTFNDNEDNTACNTTATFLAAGTYTFTVTVSNNDGLSVSSTVDVNVVQTLASLSVSPANITVPINGQQAFTIANTLDQFGNEYASYLQCVWSIDNADVGSIDQIGNFTAGSSTGNAVVTAQFGSVSATTNVSVVSGANTATVHITASSNPVTGTSTQLSAVLNNNQYDPASLTYTWGASDPSVTFSDNSDNTAQATTATFMQPGSFILTVVVSNSSGQITSASILVTVNQVLSIQITPSMIALPLNSSQQFKAIESDQFNNIVDHTLPFTWSNNGVGSIDASGNYSSGAVKGTATVSASLGSLSGTANIIVTDSITSPTTAAPYIIDHISADPNPVMVGASTTLSVLADDDSGALNLVYTWSVVGNPPGTVTFSSNGTNDSKYTTATFSQTGDYNLQVKITNNIGLYVIDTISIKVNTANTPSGLKAIAGDKQVLLTWDPVDNAFGYSLYRGVKGSTESTLLTYIDNNNTAYVDRDIQNGNTYWYAIATAINDTTESSISEKVYALPSAQPGVWKINFIPESSTSYSSPPVQDIEGQKWNLFTNVSNDIENTVSSITLSGLLSVNKAANAHASISGHWEAIWIPDASGNWPSLISLDNEISKDYSVGMKNATGIAIVSSINNLSNMVITNPGSYQTIASSPKIYQDLDLTFHDRPVFSTKIDDESLNSSTEDGSHNGTVNGWYWKRTSNNTIKTFYTMSYLQHLFGSTDLIKFTIPASADTNVNVKVLSSLIEGNTTALANINNIVNGK